jgi:site-specific recombinase XerD
MFIYRRKNLSDCELLDCSFANIEFIRSITMDDFYAFIAYLQNERRCSIATCGRKIISIRQFWKYLKNNVYMIENNIAEKLEIPKQPKRIPKYLNLEDSIRLLMSVEDSPRNYCIVTLFLNCALRLTELTSLNVSQICTEAVTVIGKGNKERQIFLTTAAKNSINSWINERNNYKPKDDALFISNRGSRLTTRAIQIIIKNATEKAGLIGKISPHTLRHTAATLLYKHGHVDIRALQKILGHESISTTEIYTHIDNRQLQIAVNANPLSEIINRIQIRLT